MLNHNQSYHLTLCWGTLPHPLPLERHWINITEAKCATKYLLSTCAKCLSQKRAARAEFSGLSEQPRTLLAAYAPSSQSCQPKWGQEIQPSAQPSVRTCSRTLYNETLFLAVQIMEKKPQILTRPLLLFLSLVVILIIRQKSSLASQKK